MRISLVASLAALLAAPVHAAMTIEAPIGARMTATPFGAISSGWSAVLPPVQVGGSVLRDRALEPVAPVLDRSGLTPESFSVAAPDVQASLLYSAMPQASDWIALRTEAIRVRAND